MQLRKQIEKFKKELFDEQEKLVRTKELAKVEREALEARLVDLETGLAEEQSLCNHLGEELEDEKRETRAIEGQHAMYPEVAGSAA